MPNRLADALSPYLRSHADNPVDWWGWGAEPFAEAAERGVPVLVSIGYSTCHWCHVMARESFGDPAIAEILRAGFVAVKVDREEHPEVDAAYLAAAGAFTEQLGWPLNVFVTPEGRTFFAGTYWPPQPVAGHPSFRQVLAAVGEAWTDRRAEVEATSQAVQVALASVTVTTTGDLPTGDGMAEIVAGLVAHEDTMNGGFGGAPKFPVAPVLTMLLDRGSIGDRDASALAARTLTAMASSALRDPIDGGFFRYSTRRDWTEPHYERMLYDNAQLLGAYSRVADGVPIAEGIAQFLESSLRRPGGAFGSAQDSESTVGGARVEGGYYLLDAAQRALEHPPAVDEKVLTGWNGLAIGQLATAGMRLGRDAWISLARDAADQVLARHALDGGLLARASVGDRVSTAPSTLEDYGMFAAGLLRLSLATGDVAYAERGRLLVDACMTAGAADASVPAFQAPGGGDPVLAAQHLEVELDPSEGAYPSGLSAIAEAACILYSMTGRQEYAAAARQTMGSVARLSVARPISFGAALSVMSGLDAGAAQVVIIDESGGRSELAAVARGRDRVGTVVTILDSGQARAFSASGFGLFDDRVARNGEATAYVCRDLVCRLPVTDPAELTRELAR